MSKKAKNILSLNHEEVMEFFMKSDEYHGFDLPEYFVFNDLLAFVKDKIGVIPYNDCIKKDILPDNLPDVNHDILLNKDGRYGVRPLILANPYLYYFLVREICCKSGWKAVKDCFSKFTVPHIVSCAIPVIPEEKEKFHKSTSIFNWWNALEQRAIELSLEYRYMFVSDITNCYGSINPQSIDWALGLKNTKYETNKNIKIAHNIQTYLKALQHGRNIGIPQGSTIFDLVGEIVLGYSDLLLHEKLMKAKRQGKIKNSYEILRFRDDYRVFSNDKDELEIISYLLQEVLESLNFRMNSQKTFISDSIVTDAIKSDKLFYIFNTPIFNKKGVDFDSYEKHLLYILMFGRKHQNCGQMKNLLSDLDDRIKKYLNPEEDKEKENNMAQEANLEEEPKEEDKNEATKGEVKEKRKPEYIPGGSIRAMSAVATQIALENVSSSHYALRVLSRMINVLTDAKEQNFIIDKVSEKIINQPNSTYNQLWLQNMTYQRDKKAGKSPYDMRLCRLVAGDESVTLWNNTWLKDELVSDLPYSSIVNQEVLSKITPVITFRETRRYYEGI